MIDTKALINHEKKKKKKTAGKGRRRAEKTTSTVERDVGARGAGSGAVSVSVSIPGLVAGGEDSMAAGKGAGKPASPWDSMRVRFIVCFLGVFVCYFYYGILQETM